MSKSTRSIFSDPEIVNVNTDFRKTVYTVHSIALTNFPYESSLNSYTYFKL